MPKEIKAWAADTDGSTHPTEYAAACHDCRERLKRLGIFNEGTINAIMERKEELYHALHTAIVATPPLDGQEAPLRSEDTLGLGKLG